MQSLVIRFAILVGALNLLGGASIPASAADGDQAVPAALRSIFSPRKAPARRTMGLSQRTFLDLVEESKPKLEVAIVIDATESMADALAGVRDALSQMMADLELYKENEISYQIVIYRDAGAPSGEVSFPLTTAGRGFTANREAVLKAIEDLKPESGAPYFPEVVDEGVQQALAKLQWSDNENVSRWLLLFGDAPPFDPTLNEEDTGARRRVATDALVALANTKQVRINCILCTTREADRAVYEKVLDQTRAFMNALSSGTGGVMLDLSYDDIRAAILDADEIKEVEYSPMGTISGDEVEQVRAKLHSTKNPNGAPVSIVILPHTALDNMSFASDTIGAQLATELRLRIKAIPGLNVVEPLVVERRFEQLRRDPKSSGLTGEALLQALGRTLRANYVLWGEVKENNGARTASTRLYDTATGEMLTKAERSSGAAVGTEQLGSLLASDLLAASIGAAAHQPLALHLAAVNNNTTAQGAVTFQISASSAHDDLIEGLGDLEAALSYPAGNATGKELLDKAHNRLEEAVNADDTNPLAHYLLANCLFNLAKQKQMDGESSEELMKRFGRAIRSAYRFRTALPDRGMQREIEADYALMVRGKPEEAIPLYEQLADQQGEAEVAKRANWMLAGIYGGDWGVDPKFVNREKARGRLVRILALWPDSSEAWFIKRVMRWDDAEGKTRFPHLPKENESLAEQVDREA
jgi:tetratricopeptide (TPR) repeat protein